MLEVSKITENKLFHRKTLCRFNKFVIGFKNSLTTYFSEQLLTASDLFPGIYIWLSTEYLRDYILKQTKAMGKISSYRKLFSSKNFAVGK